MKKNLRLIIIFIFIIAVVLGFYYYVSNIRELASADDNARATNVQAVLFRNLDNRYPPTPKEVVNFFAEITRCLYNEEYNNRDFEALGEQLYRLYDEELQEENIPLETYLENLRFDVNSHRDKGYAISSYLVSSSTDVIYFSEEGFDYARLYCLFTMRQNTELFPVEHQFLLRKSDSGHWKILGWQREEF